MKPSEDRQGSYTAKHLATVLRFPKRRHRKQSRRRNKKLAPVLMISERRIPCLPANFVKNAH